MIPFRILFDGIRESEALRSEVEDRIQKLERFYHRIVRCEVILSIPHRHRRIGRLGQAHVHIHLPGKDIVISRDSATDAHKDIYLAVRDAFHAAERALEDRVRVQRKGPIRKARRSRAPIEAAG
jgi:ribosomal subunit interface protein